MPPKARKASWLAVCVALCASSEGLRQTAYRDPAPLGTWTYCLGETRRPDGSPVQKGDHATVAECHAMLEGRLMEYAVGVEKCTTVWLPDARLAAMTDFAYNEGVGRYCRNIAPLLNSGQTSAACDHLLAFTTAGGIELPGLVTRRKKERELCREGL